MRAAPAVQLEIGLSPGWRFAQALIWALAAAALCAWLAARNGHQAVLGLWGGLPSGLLAWRLSPGRAATLHWNGEQWHLGGAPVRATVAMDLDRWLLLALQPSEVPGRRHWLPATALQAGARWHALRAALYSRAPESPLAASTPASRQGGSAPD
jgi:hypothetical protein